MLARRLQVGRQQYRRRWAGMQRPGMPGRYSRRGQQFGRWGNVRYRRGGGHYHPSRELKFHDLVVDDAVVPATGANTLSFCLIQQGIQETGRIGRKCVVKSVAFRYTVATPTDAILGDTIRIIIVWDKQANGSIPAVTGVLDTASLSSYLNLENSGRFVVLMNRFHTINIMASGTATGTWPNEQYHTFFKKVNIPIEFSGTAGVIGEITSNNIYAIYITANGNAGVFDSKVRIRFQG